jgi:hypothetical protein
MGFLVSKSRKCNMYAKLLKRGFILLRQVEIDYVPQSAAQQIVQYRAQDSAVPADT